MKSSTPLFKLLLASCLASVLVACGNNADSSGNTNTASTAATGFAGTSTSTTLSANAYTPTAASTASSTASAQSSPLKTRDLSAAPTATAVNLGAPTTAQSAAAQKSSSNFKAGKPLQVGFSRQVAQTGTVASTQAVLKWQATPAGGQAAAISFTSTGAKAMRIGLLVTQLPETATLRFYAKGATQAYEFSGKEVQTILARNLAAGDKTDAGRTFWGPVIEGVEGTVEIALPAGVGATTVQVAVPKVSHMFVSQQKAMQMLVQPQASSNNGSSTCHVDIKCTDPLPQVSTAVSMIIYNDPFSQYQYICTGTLLNDSINSGKAYILTANHCAPDQTSASSIGLKWFYLSNTCNGYAYDEFGVGYSYPPATLLYTSYKTDTSLLLLDPYQFNNLLGTVTFAGWDASTPAAMSTAVTGIHHPNYDPQRLASGTVVGYSTRDPNPEFYDTFYASNLANSTFLEVTLTNGIVEPGSDGSALFKNFTTNPQVIGQLYAGDLPSCASPTVSNPQSVRYGRFDVAYKAGLSDWLTPVGNKAVSRFYNSNSGTHFYTMSASEASYVQENFPSFSFEGTPFKASVQAVAGLSPVHRFYNLDLGVHFYTINDTERAWVVANLPQMRYEGIAWYAQPGSGGGTIPLYRFYNRDKGVHFYTVSASERASVIANLPQMADEGIAYYVLP